MARSNHPLEARLEVLEQSLMEMQKTFSDTQRIFQDLVHQQQHPRDPFLQGHRIEVPHEGPVLRTFQTNPRPKQHQEPAFQANPKATVLQFPWFYGADVQDWVSQSNNYFQNMKTPLHFKVKIASQHLWGDALKWYIFKQKNRAEELWPWTDFVRCVVTRFLPERHADPMVELSNLKQTRGIESHVNRFNRVEVCDSNEKGLFLGGLKSDNKLGHRVGLDSRVGGLDGDLGLDGRNRSATSTPAFGIPTTNSTLDSPTTLAIGLACSSNISNPFTTNTSAFGATINPSLGSTNTTLNSTTTPAVGATTNPSLGSTGAISGSTTTPAFELCKCCNEKFFRVHICQSKQCFFVVAGDEEQYTSNYGFEEEKQQVGKSAAIDACAKEQGFETLLEDVDVTFAADRDLIAAKQQIADNAKGLVLLTSNSYDHVLPINLYRDIQKSIIHVQFYHQGGEVERVSSTLVFDPGIGHQILPKMIPCGFPSQLSELVEKGISLSLSKMEEPSSFVELHIEEFGSQAMHIMKVGVG